MRRSPKRHALAALRLKLGLTQKEIANLAGCAAVTIKKIETGQLALSGNLAQHIGAVTGVHEGWLVEGDPDEEMVAEDCQPYTRAHFEDRQAMLFARKHSRERRLVEHEFTPEVLALALMKIYSMIRSGHAQSRFSWTIYKIQMALNAAEREVGTDTRFAGEKMVMDLPEHGAAKLRKAVEMILKAHGEAENSKDGKRGKQVTK